MNERLKKLYKSVILKHNKSPYHYEKTNAAHQVPAYNPLCGDRFDLYVDVQDGHIQQIHFHGYGCAISKASTSVLVKHLEHKPIAAAIALCKVFEAHTQGESIATSEIIEEEFEAFEAAQDFPGRLTCATLSWEAIKEVLSNSK